MEDEAYNVMGDAAVAPDPVDSDGESSSDEAVKAGKFALGELHCIHQVYLARTLRGKVCGPDKIIDEFPDGPS